MLGKFEKMGVKELERSVKRDAVLVLVFLAVFTIFFALTWMFFINFDLILSVLFGTMYLGFFLVVAVVSLFFKRLLLFIKKNLEG